MAGTLKTAATMLDLDTLRAETLIDNAEPVRLAQSIEALDAWTSRRLMVVDDVLTNWVQIASPAPTIARGSPTWKAASRARWTRPQLARPVYAMRSPRLPPILYSAGVDSRRLCGRVT